MKFITHADETFAHEWPSSLQGTIQASYLQLCYAFGGDPQPREGRSTMEWMLKFEDGSTAGVYDWNRAGPIDQETVWHICSKNRAGAERVHEEFRTAMKTFQDINRRIA